VRVIFAGTPDFAATALRAIRASKHSVCAVYSQPDRPSGRGQKLQPSPVKRLAAEYGLPVFQPERLKGDEAVLAQLRSFAADIMVVVAYGLILPPSVLTIPRLGCVNIHASLLPRWRGAAPIQRALLAGDRETGITIIQMDAGLDTGPMLAHRACSIAADDTGQSLHDKLAVLGGTLMVEVLDRLEHGALASQPQVESGACYAAKIDKAEAWIDWGDDAPAVARKVRAFNGWPVARTLLAGQSLLVWRAVAEPGKANDALPGTVLDVGAEGILVAAGGGIVRLLEVQVPGGRPLTVAEFLRGRTIACGSCLTAPERFSTNY
jgi:methionyl-tRNA formyltransferase